MRALLTTLDMPAERCGTTALDGRHHLQLGEADVTDIGRAPRRPVVAQDIRDLQRWTGHCRGLRRRLRLLAVLRSFPPGPLTRWPCQPVERALDGGNHAGGDVEIAYGRFQFLVTQEHLDLSDMRVVLEQVSGEAVAQGMQRHAFLDRRRVGRFME